LPVSRLICLVDPDNQASRHVAEKIGMTLEKEGDIQGYQTALYSISKQENDC
jgi:RimJ/RimL family protein N-acetyltransferase